MPVKPAVKPLLREYELGNIACASVDPYECATLFTSHRLELYGPLITLCRKELNTGSAVGSGVSLARKLLILMGETQ